MKDNILKTVGDTLIIRINPIISGKITFNGFVEELLGITETRFVLRDFRISTDGIFWSEWRVLNNSNLLASGSHVTDSSVFIEIKYTRAGTETSGEIEFKSIDFTGNREEIEFIAPTIMSSVFSNIIGSEELRKLEQNIFKKMYYNGVIPRYITRAENDDKNEDSDFIDLWFTVSRFYSMFIQFFKRFEDMSEDFDLLRENVRQVGLYFDESNVTIEELKYLSKNYHDEIRKRGTVMIFKRKEEVLRDGTQVPVDGELIRLLRSKPSDELLYENIPLKRTGWCLGNSSPLFRGTADSKSLNKVHELNSLQMFKSGNGSYSVKVVDNESVMSLRTNGIGTSGFGRLLDESVTNLFTSDSSLDYEVSFAFKVVSGKTSELKLSLEIEGFDVLKNKLNDSFITLDGNSVTDLVFDKNLINVKNGIWYFVRGVIHAYSTAFTENVLTNLGTGNNLCFNNSFVKFILPKIKVSNNTSCEVYVKDYSIKPLVRGANILPLKNGTEDSFSTGFIQSSRIAHTYARNNNNNQSLSDVSYIIEKYLYPFGGIDIFTFMSNY